MNSKTEIGYHASHEQWSTNILPNHLLSDLTQISHFREAATFVKPEDLKGMVHVSADLQQPILFEF